MAIRRIRRHRRVAKRKVGGVSARRRVTLRRKAKRIAYSIKAPVRTYHALEKKIDKAWQKLRRDVKRRSLRAIIKGRRDLLLLLGECNYLARECARCVQKQ
jgi:hypothetical protein